MARHSPVPGLKQARLLWRQIPIFSKSAAEIGGAEGPGRGVPKDALSGRFIRASRNVLGTVSIRFPVRLVRCAIYRFLYRIVDRLSCRVKIVFCVSPWSFAGILPRPAPASAWRNKSPGRNPRRHWSDRAVPHRARYPRRSGPCRACGPDR